MKKNKLLLLLVLLMTAATGAWAQTETLLTTITATGTGSYSETTPGVVTVTHDNGDFDGDYGWLWWENSGSVTVEAKEGYTITKCVFHQTSKSPVTVSTAPFKVNFVYDEHQGKFLCEGMDGVSSIEVYGYAAPTTYTVSMKDGVKDADKWTITPNPAEEGQTVTLQYNGRLKVKGVKATSDAPAAPASTTLNNTITAWTAGSYAVPAGGLTYSDAITVSGDVTLTLTDGETLTLNKGISLASGATLTIQGNGAMVVNGTNENTTSTVAGSTGTLTLTSGTLTATGGNGGSGVYDSYGGNGGDAINGSVIVSGGTLTATGGNGGSSPYGDYNCHGGNGGDAINGSVTVSSGTLTARGGNGGSVDDFATLSSGGNGGDAISGTLTKNGGSTSVNDGSNGSIGNMCDNCTAGTGGKATAEPAAKEPATVTTAPTGAAIVGVGKTTALVSGGAAEGGTLMYKVTTENTNPASTDDFSEAVPTAQSITASGKVYVWYYVKGDDTHSDSEIAATAIEVPVADIVWDATNISDLYVSGTYASSTIEGITLSGNADQMSAMWNGYGDPTHDGIAFNMNESGGYTFTAPNGKAFTKIVMKPQGQGGWDMANLGTGWTFNADYNEDIEEYIFTVTWKGNAAASTVVLLKDADMFAGETISYIVFYLSDAE